MVRIQKVLTIIKKELFGILDSPAAYIALILFVVFWEFLFFRSALVVGEASVRGLFDYLPWLLLFFAAAVTMTAFSQEKSEGTLELLLTHPITEAELIAGKFISVSVFILFGLLFSVFVAISFSFFTPLDWGIFVGQLLSGAFLSIAFTAMGICISLFLGNPVSALIASSVAGFFFILLGSDFITQSLPLSLVPFFERLSLLSHVSSMARGVVDVGDVWFFVGFTLVFLSLTYLLLLQRKYGNRRDRYQSYVVGISLFIGIVVLSSILGNRIPGRIDLTANRAYTISSATQKTLSTLPDIVTITLYASSKLPSQFAPTVRDTKDLLRDYQSLGHGKISVVVRDPSNNAEVSQEANGVGVKEVQFNVIGSEEFQLKTGYLGLVVSYSDKHEVIPYLDRTNDLEYRLTSMIVKLTNTERKKVAFISGQQEKAMDSDLAGFTQELKKQFDVVDTKLVPGQFATDAAVLVIAGPKDKIDETGRGILRDYIHKGKGVFFLIDQYTVQSVMPTARINPNSNADFLTEYGVNVDSTIVYDLRSNETVRLNNGPVSYLLPYPYWIRAISAPKSTILSSSDGILAPWASSISTVDDVITSSGSKVEQLLVTSPYAGVSGGEVTVSPDKIVVDNKNLKQYALATAVTQKNNARLVVVGNSLLITDQALQNAPQNLLFGVSAVSWLSNDDRLAGIRIRDANPRKLLFRSPSDPTFVKFGNFGIAILIPLGIGAVRFLRRRKLANMKYRKSVSI
jgi:ABC-type uncharacterized transport system involved in gliding motility auxiliary subunit/ABC-type transport system involved in multi-copper enzyme maturation permease subunit